MIEIEQSILNLADQLGRAMAQSQRTRLYKQRHAETQADVEAQALLAEYHKHIESLARKEHAGKPIEVHEKHKLADLQGRISGHEKLKALIAAQADYLEMVRQVNDAISRHLVATEGVAGGQRGQ